MNKTNYYTRCLTAGMVMGFVAFGVHALTGNWEAAGDFGIASGAALLYARCLVRL